MRKDCRNVLCVAEERHAALLRLVPSLSRDSLEVNATTINVPLAVVKAQIRAATKPN